MFGKLHKSSRVLQLSIKLARSRNIHTVPDLQHDKAVGIPGLFSPKGLDIAWFQYQQYVLDNLNEKLKQRDEYTGSDFETPSAVMVAALEHAATDDVAKDIARWASLAYANEFFFRSLSAANRNADAVIGASTNKSVDVSTDPAQLVATMPNTSETSSVDGATDDFSYTVAPLQRFLTTVDSSFDSQQAFRELVISRGSSMFGNGFLWMIVYADSYNVLNTYNWGTPQSSKSTEKSQDSIDFAVNNSIQTFNPLLAISVWQHTYLHDYGFEGKRDFLKNVFDTINWDMVVSRAENH